MKRLFERLRCLWMRAAVSAATLGTSATLLLAVSSAFYSVSSAPALSDSPQARSAVVDCDALHDPAARQCCRHRLAAEAQAREPGAAQLVALSARPRGKAP